MSADCCIVCGIEVEQFDVEIDEQWRREYRAIYSHPSGCSVTGAGCYDGSAILTPPLDPARRWDDHDDPQLLELTAMNQSPPEACHGFILHDACWMLLRKAWEPEHIPVDRLVGMCKSLPFPLRANGLAWPHMYGGLCHVETKNFYPWQEIMYMPPDDSDLALDALENLYHVPDLFGILSTCERPQPQRGMKKTAAPDTFSRLPWELREIIATFLETHDALVLRQASASFLPLLSSSAFWASRFTNDQDRGFVFEAHDRRGPIDWLELYRLTGPRCNLPGLRNRCRVWHLIKQLKRVAAVHLEGNPVRVSEQLLAPPWSQVTGDLAVDTLDRGWRPYEDGCCSLHTIVVPLPGHLSKIGVSTINIGTWTYISGLRFIVHGMSESRVGYISGNETVLTLQELCGFRVAASPSGIRGLQVIDDAGQPSQWCGCSSDIPISDRLILSGPIEAVTVKLDGFKVIGLGVTATDVAGEQSFRTSRHTLRETALWYPGKPPLGLNLNDSSFTGQSPSDPGYRPLIWNHFGGPKGRRLKHFTKLSIRGPRKLMSVEFVYDDGYDGCSSSYLGRCNPEDVSPGSVFAIDGPTGEHILSIAVHIIKNESPGVYDFIRHGALKCFKITTDRGREFWSRDKCDHTEMRDLAISPGTTITGLYASHDSKIAYGLISLGVISEALEDHACA